MDDGLVPTEYDSVRTERGTPQASLSKYRATVDSVRSVLRS